MLAYIVPAWLITTIVGCCIVNTSSKSKSKVKVCNCRKLIKKYKKLDDTYNKSFLE